MGAIATLLREAKNANFLSDRVTIEYVLQRLSEGWMTQVAGPTGGIALATDHSALIISRELPVFIGASQATLPILCDLWDSHDEYIYGTRGKGEVKIKEVCVSILGGCTPSWLGSDVIAQAVSGGFTRRVNFVVGRKRENLIPWPQVMNHKQIIADLINDLVDIGKLRGEFRFSPKAALLFEKIYRESDPSEYDDEATTSYKTSKWAQATKLSMCLSASRGSDLIIAESDFDTAVRLVESVSQNVPRVFRSVGESDLTVAADRVLRFIESKGYASRQEILKANWRDVTSDELDRVLATLNEGGVIYSYEEGRKTLWAAVEKPPE